MRTYRRMKLKLFTFSIQVCTPCHFIGQPPSLKTEHIEIREQRLLAQTSLVERKDAELVKMQTKLSELVLFHDRHMRVLEQARAADANEYEIELAKVRAELEARKSELEARKFELEARKFELEAGKFELEAIRLRLTDAEIGWAKSKTDPDTLRALNTTSLTSTDEDRIARRLLDRMRTMEAEMASLRWSEKNFEAMETRNEG